MEENKSKKRERGANYTAEEKTLLADLVKRYEHIIDDKRTGGAYVTKKREAWKAVTMKYNSFCTTTGPRETEQLKVLYDNMKQRARKSSIESIKPEPIPKKYVIDDDLNNSIQNIKEEKDPVEAPYQYNNGAGFFKDYWDSSSLQNSSNSSMVVEPCPMGAVREHPVQEIDWKQTDHKDLSDSQNSSKLVIEVEPCLHSFKEEPAEETDWKLNSGNGHRIQQLETTVNVEKLPSTTPQKVNRSECVKKVPKKQKCDLSAETLKKTYFKRKCENASLERKKLLLEIYHMKQEHNLRMAVLKKKLE